MLRPNPPPPPPPSVKTPWLVWGLGLYAAAATVAGTVAMLGDTEAGAGLPGALAAAAKRADRGGGGGGATPTGARPAASKSAAFHTKRRQRELQQDLLWIHELLSNSVEPFTGYDVFGAMAASGALGKVVASALASDDVGAKHLGYELCDFILWKHHGGRLAIGPGPHFDKLAKCMVEDATRAEEGALLCHDGGSDETARRVAARIRIQKGNNNIWRQRLGPVEQGKVNEMYDLLEKEGLIIKVVENKMKKEGMITLNLIDEKGVIGLDPAALNWDSRSIQGADPAAAAERDVRLTAMEVLSYFADELFSGGADTATALKQSAKMRSTLVKALITKDKGRGTTPLEDMASAFRDIADRVLEHHTAYKPPSEFGMENNGSSRATQSWFLSKWNDLNLLRHYVTVIASLSEDPQCAKALKSALPTLEKVCRALSPIVVGHDLNYRKQDNMTLIRASNAFQAISAATGRAGKHQAGAAAAAADKNKAKTKTKKTYRNKKYKNSGSNTKKGEENPNNASTNALSPDAAAGTVIHVESAFGSFAVNSPRCVAALSWLHLPQNKDTWRQFGEDCSLAVSLGLPWGAARSAVSMIRQKSTANLFQAVMRGSVRSSLGAIMLVSLVHWFQWSHKRMHAGRAWTAIELGLEKVVAVSVLARVLVWSPFAFLPALAANMFNKSDNAINFYHEVKSDVGGEFPGRSDSDEGGRW